jgi:MFS family permease
MAFYLIVLVTIINHVAFKGSKLLITLFAIELGANPLEIGVVFAMYSFFPVFLSVYAGKVSDRLGFRAPMLFGSVGLVAGLTLPFAMPQLASLYISATLIGMCYIFYVVSVQHLVGSFGEGPARTRNYSIFSLGIGLTALLGPTTAGFAIDLFGHRATYALLALFPLVPIAMLAFFSRIVPRPEAHRTDRREHRVMDLVANVPLRRTLIASATIETGLELVNFLLPIYGHSIGLSASQIGVLLGAFALALLAVRTMMPALVRRSSEERVLSVSLSAAALTLLAFPAVADFTLLLAMAFLLGLGLGCGAPVSLVLAYNRAPAGRSGEAIGLRQTVNKATEMLVPIVFGSLSTAFGMIPVFWLDALMLAYGGALMRGDAHSKIKSGPSSPAG